MLRIARVVIPDIPHHIIQRGNRRQPVFFSDEIKNWADYLTEEDDKNDLVLFRSHCNTGRPLGDEKFIDFLEKISGRLLHRGKSGPKKRNDK